MPDQRVMVPIKMEKVDAGKGGAGQDGWKPVFFEALLKRRRGQSAKPNIIFLVDEEGSWG